MGKYLHFWGHGRSHVTFERVPAEPPAELWSGELVPRPDLPDLDDKGLLSRRLRPEDVETELPIISIGRPQTLRSLTTRDLPGYAEVVPTDFYLVRLWCSFRDFGTELQFSQAQFTVSLLAGNDERVRVVAHDMYPSQVLHKVKRDVHVALSPQVKFMEVDVKLGEFQYGFAYDELQPQVVAAGHGEPTPSWVFSRTQAQRLQGGKALHLVVAAPAGTARATARLNLTAYVTKPGFIPLPMGLLMREGMVPAEPLEVDLW